MKLDVLIPALFLPAPLMQSLPPPAVPALERLLARATAATAPPADLAAWLAARFALTPRDALAPVLAAADGLSANDGGWLLAEPVHLEADRDSLVLSTADSLAIAASEAAALVDALNAHFAQDGLRFHLGAPGRWYAQCAPGEIPMTFAPAEARRGRMIERMPQSSGALNWRAMQNEIQMLLFAHPVNQAREERRQPTINGVWFWGGGAMPTLAHPRYDALAAEDPLARALAKRAGIDPVTPAHAAIAGHDRVLAVLDGPLRHADAGDFPGWSAELERLDREWFAPLLADRRLESLALHVADGERARVFTLTRTQRRWRFWRGVKPLAAHA